MKKKLVKFAYTALTIYSVEADIFNKDNNCNKRYCQSLQIYALNFQKQFCLTIQKKN